MLPERPITRLNAHLSIQDLSSAELCSARLDGEVFALGDSWYPIDQIDGPVNRAHALRLLVSVDVVAERSSAAWIYGLAAEPACHEARLDSRARKHVAPSVRLRVREVRDPHVDTVAFEGMRVTTPVRTAVDLALCRQHHVDDTEEHRLVALLAALLLYDGCPNAQETLSRCAPEHSPSGLRALDRLEAAQALLDR